MHRILTLPSIANYGGLLQAYALQRVVARLGVQVGVIDFEHKGAAYWFASMGAKEKLRQWLIFLKVLLGAKHRKLHLYIHSILLNQFKRHFPKRFMLDAERRQLVSIPPLDSFIVGSDQVWRCEYSRPAENVPFFFLSFAAREQRQRSIAYAASFGSDEWEGTPEETEECARLLKDFKAVSVREHSGVRLCREVFGVEAVQMPDPTLLLEADDYSRVIRRSLPRSLPEPFMAVYLLDETARSISLYNKASQGLYLQHLMPHNAAPHPLDRIPLPVTQWLRSMRDCECVLTDSFHGCAFAIIFNKPFVCLGNEARGSARFDSLLRTFGLQERMLTNPTAEQVTECMRTPIDWERVNASRHAEQQRAFTFLKQHLKQD